MSGGIRHTNLADELPGEARTERASAPGILGWMARRPRLILALLTLACLLPFSGKAVHIDDPIFIWTAQQITKHPLNFYGFSATWWSRATPMWQIQQNPPLAAYYMAFIGSIAGWSERALHLGFLIPAVVVVLATYGLAQRLTRKPFLAAVATLVAPGFLVSATGLMCDVSMLALWLLAISFWIEGIEETPKPMYLAISALLIAACALTKYFGMSLIPLLFVYTLVRQRSFRGWIGYLVIPLLVLGGYEFYTHQLYGYGLIWLAAGNPSTSGSGAAKITVRYANFRTGNLPRRALLGIVFAGGCALPALTSIPLLWSRRQILLASTTGGLLAVTAFFGGWIHLSRMYYNQEWLRANRMAIILQLLLYVAGGISILALAVADFWKKRNASSLLLVLWIAGTMLFAVAVNWDVNARTLLPLIPAVAILIARRVEGRKTLRHWRAMVTASLMVSAAIALWVAVADTALANTARLAANYVRERTRDDSNTIWFQGRWGFEYYVEQFGARPLELEADQCRVGDFIVTPKYNLGQFKIPLELTAPETVNVDVPAWLTTMNPDAGAGFYYSGWGPLPFVFGPVPPQRYLMARVLEAP